MLLAEGLQAREAHLPSYRYAAAREARADPAAAEHDVRDCRERCAALRPQRPRRVAGAHHAAAQERRSAERAGARRRGCCWSCAGRWVTRAWRRARDRERIAAAKRAPVGAAVEAHAGAAADTAESGRAGFTRTFAVAVALFASCAARRLNGRASPRRGDASRTRVACAVSRADEAAGGAPALDIPGGSVLAASMLLP